MSTNTNLEQFSAWVEIDLFAIQNNITLIRQTTQKKVMAVVKANGYGHGLTETARAAEKAGAAWCGVARIEEALTLRQNGFELPVLVLGYTPPDRITEAIQNHISVTVYDPLLLEAYSHHINQGNEQINVHAKIDTSMGRLGVQPEHALDFIRKIKAQQVFHLEGVFTHFAMADEPAKVDTINHIQNFKKVIDAISEAGLRPALVHAANSATTLYFPEGHFDMVRPGIAIYGLHPSAEAPLPSGFQPALTLKTRLTSVKMVPAHHGIGYNARYVTTKTEKIGALGIGYADGFRRRLGNFGLLHGKRVNVAGGVCMDQCMVQLDEFPQANIGDEVVLIGKQGNNQISAEEVAAAWNTNNYEVVCGMAARLPRIYRG